MSLRIQVNPNDEVTVDEVGGGGGNPNYVETITGTLGNCVGDSGRFQEIAGGIQDNSLTARISGAIPGSGPFTGFLQSNSTDDIHFSFAEVDREKLMNLQIYWIGLENGGASIESMYAYIIQGENATNISSSVPTYSRCILTITHHPLPEQS